MGCHFSISTLLIYHTTMTNRFTSQINIQNNDIPMTQTTNGMPTQVSSMDTHVDLFFTIGASRGKDISAKFIQAFNENQTIALKLLAWARDIRQGAGEREIVRQCLKALEKHTPESLIKFLPHLPEFGRYDDLFIFETTPVKYAAFKIIQDALKSGNQLAGKWTPRKGKIAAELRQFLQLSPKQYRKLLVNTTNVVETKMCANEWTSINYGHVPSIAAKNYQKAFNKHDAEGYGAYKEALSTGEAKINASAIFPHDVLRCSDRTVIEAQWKALPNYLEGAVAQHRLILPVCDVSGSMSCSAGKNTSLTCMEVFVALGLYIADKNEGAFKDVVCTFSAKPNLVKLQSKSILDKKAEIERLDWGMNTNLELTFEKILETGIKGKVPQSDMPTDVIIFSDMQFDIATTDPSDTAMKMIERMYEQAGYKVPKVIFWNLNASVGVPVSFSKSGVALVSGFSPSIMKSILGASDFSPVGIMMQTLDSERYVMIG